MIDILIFMGWIGVFIIVVACAIGLCIIGFKEAVEDLSDRCNGNVIREYKENRGPLTDD